MYTTPMRPALKQRYDEAVKKLITTDGMGKAEKRRLLDELIEAVRDEERDIAAEYAAGENI